MNRKLILRQLSDLVLQRKAEAPLRVGVDCAGKTSLSADLRQVIESRGFKVIEASIDHFSLPQSKRYERGALSPAGYYYDAFDYAAVQELLLKPISTPPFPKVCSRGSFDSRTDSPILLDTCIARSDTVLLFEGIFLFRPELNHYWDYRIFVDISFETSLARALQRDVSLLGDSHMVKQKYEHRYMPAQRLYLEAVNPQSLADVVVHNNNPEEPEITILTDARLSALCQAP
jgi:uridine kinase